MTNYAITLRPLPVSESQIVARLAACSQPFQQTINPVNYLPLYYNPVTISIKTNSPDGSRETGKLQPSIWAMAYFNRLRTLTRDPVLTTLPLILVSNEYWQLMFA